MTANLDLNAPAFVPRRLRTTKSNDGSAHTTSPSNSRGKAAAPQFVSIPQMSPQPASAHPQTSHQQAVRTFHKQLLYWEPKDANGYPLEEAYCVESMPSDFWKRSGDFNDTVVTFQKCLKVDL